MKRLGKWLSYIILGLVVFFFVFTLLMPVVFSGRLAIVYSSSMEPAMRAGALAMMMPVAPETVKVGDIIAFEPPWDPDVTVSHRVFEVLSDGELAFRTKGDANEDPDSWFIPAEYVTSKVVFNIPYLGYAINYALNYVRTWWGFIFLVAVPSTVLIGSTIRDVSRVTNRRQKRKELWLKRRRQRK